MTRIWSTPGGVHPEERKQQSLTLPLAEAGLPAELVLPLNQHIGAPAEPLVKVGERVLAGQKIAAAQGIFSAAIHASSSGTVSAIEERPLPHPSGMAGDCIVIEPDGLDQHIDYVPCDDYRQLDHATLVQKIRDAGITGMGGASFPTAVKLNPKTNQPVDTLILNGTECEPYITADDMLMRTRPADIVEGARLLARILGDPERIVIGLEDNKPEAAAALREAAGDGPIEVVTFPTKYPSGGEKQLIQILTGREVPSEKLPADIGVIVQNVGTAVAAWEAVRFGKPLISRITTVVGEALSEQRNLLVRLGTPIEYLLQRQGLRPERAARLILGGPMMGFALETSEVPVVKASNCVLVPSREEMPPPPPAQACIRCGMCAEACPASLLPQQLYWYAQAEDYERLQAHNLRDCIECGACSFVCPSNIPLVQYYRAAKGTLRQMEIDRIKSDRARARFEFRQERIARAEAEKEAKRQARKRAAEQARQKLAAAPAAAKPAAGKPASGDVVAAAVASARARPTAPGDERAKLERALQSAEDRLDKLTRKLAEAEEEQRDRLQAQCKQAELKLEEARKRLAALSADATGEPASDTAGTPGQTTAAADDPVSAAIARAQAKMSMSPAAKAQASIDSLRKRLAKGEDKLAAARSEGADSVDALQAGVDKLRQKLADAEAELATVSSTAEGATTAESSTTEEAASPPAQADAAGAAIERARARAAAQADMSPADKLRDQITSLEARLEKARARLARAEADNDDNLSAFQAGVDKTAARLEQARSELESLH